MASKMTGTQQIQVSVRLRPLNDREKKDQAHSTISVENKEVIVKDYPLENLTKKYTFDKVFGPDSKQVEIYKAIAMPLINEVISGYNCTVFAYGQTGTGKTFTMEGGTIDDTAWHTNSSAGMVPRTLSHLIDTLRLQQVEYTLRVSYLELYNEELFDLLSPGEDTSKIRIYEDSNKKGSIIIHGVEEVTINSKREVFKILEKGSAKRQKATTLLNAESSRSHTVFTITVHIKENTMEGEELLKIGKLNLVDLAGSENISRSGAQEKRAREAGNINQSLLTLGRVITALVERAPHIPYRESKLTRLLQESLGGRTKTSIIATISPSSYHLEETISTLEYAYRAKNITNKPEVNQKLTKKTLIKEYTTEIERLRQDLLATREKNGVYLAHENYCALQEQIAEQEKEIVGKIEQITQMNERYEKNLILFDELNMKIESFQTELETTKTDLEEKQNDLIQTRVALKNAHQAFQEQMHLVSKVDETEKKLQDQAKKLLSVANESTSDITKLYAKLDRKIEVESINKQLTTKFVDSFTDKTLQFKSDIFTNLEKKEQTVNSQEKRINVLMEKIVNYFNEQEKLNQKICKNINDFNQENSSQITSQNDFIENVKREIMANNLENLNYITTIQTMISTAFTELRQNCVEEKLEINKLFANYTTKTATEIFDFTDIFINTLNKKLSHVCEFFENEIGEKTNLIKLNKEEFIDQMHERDCLDNQIRTHINQMLELTKQKELNREREHAYISNQNILLDKMEDFKKKLSIDLNENQDDIVTFQYELANKYRNQLFGITDFKDKQEKSISELNENLIKMQNELDHLVVNQSKTFGDKLNIMKNDMDILSNNFDIHLKISNNFAMHNSSLINEHSKYLTEDKEICQEQFDEIILNNSLLVKQCKESRESISSQINAIEIQMEEFLSKDLKQDLPSGQTPQRKQFSYPLELAATSPHERIIQRYREAMNSNLSEETEAEMADESIDFKFSSDKGKSASMSSICISQVEKENSKNNGNKKRNKSPNTSISNKKYFSKKPLINITNNT